MVVVELAQVGSVGKCRAAQAAEGNSLPACEGQSHARREGCLAKHDVQAIAAASARKQQIGLAVAVEVGGGNTVVRQVGVRCRAAQPKASGAVYVRVDVSNGGGVGGASVEHVDAAATAEGLSASARCHDVVNAVSVDVSSR